MPKISFIIPAYKGRFFKEAVRSILAQTYRDFELVVVDDASPDGLRELLEEELQQNHHCSTSNLQPSTSYFVDGVRVRYYRNEENIGGMDLVAA